MPDAVPCDNGTEFTSRHFLAWCEERNIRLIHIQPGRPMQNGRVESFNGLLRDECPECALVPDHQQCGGEDRNLETGVQR